MASVKITDLTAYTDPVNTDVLPIVDVTADVTKKVSISNLMKNASAGTAAAPGIAFDGDPNTGLFSPSADQVSIATNGTERLRIDAAGQIEAVSLGSAAAPTFSFTGDPNTGIYSPGADQLAVATNGSGRLFVDANGSIGLGTSQNPTAGGFPRPVLFLKQFTDPVSGFGGVHIEASGNQSVLGIGYDGTAQVFAFDTSFRGTGARRPIIFKTTGAECMRIDASGNVGIGTTSPAYPLDLGTSNDGRARQWLATTSFIGDQGDSTGFQIRALGAGTSGMKFANYANNVEYGRFDSSGRLLVGTSSITGIAANSLVIAKGTNHGLATGRGQLSVVTSEAQAANVGGSIMLGGQSNIADWVYATISGRSENSNYAGYFAVATSTSPAGNHNEALRVNSEQELLIGYTTDNGAYKLQVNSQIFATSATIATSDGRYKENVATLGDCVDLVKVLRPVSFTWKPQEDITRIDENGNKVLVREGHNFPDGTQVGFIAQEVQEVLAEKPWLTSVIKENVRPAVTDSEGNELAPEEEFLGIAEGNLIAVLTSALQEAITKIEQLEAAVTALQQA